MTAPHAACTHGTGPTPVVRRFLTDINDGRYDHYVDLAVSTFPLFNASMRRALSLPDDDLG